jgi:hypothetical protein
VGVADYAPGVQVVGLIPACLAAGLSRLAEAGGQRRWLSTDGSRSAANSVRGTGRAVFGRVRPRDALRTTRRSGLYADGQARAGTDDPQLQSSIFVVHRALSWFSLARRRNELRHVRSTACASHMPLETPQEIRFSHISLHSQ